MKCLSFLALFFLATGLTFASAEPDRHGSFPSASPDGKRIVFASNRSAEAGTGKSAWLSMHIFSMQTDGSDVVQLTHSSTSDTAPVWTSDGKWIVFGTMDSDMSHETIEAMRADGTLRHTIVSGHFLPWVRVSPDSRQIAFTTIQADGGYSISIVNFDGSHQKVFASHLRTAWDGLWSPDGKHFVFAEPPPDPGKDPKAMSRIYIADANGEQRRLLGTYAGFLQVPSWSADGRSIAFQTYTGEKGEADIVLLDIATGQFRTVSRRDRKYLDETPTWLPDGRLALQSTRDGRFEIYVMNQNGSSPRSLTGAEHAPEK